MHDVHAGEQFEQLTRKLAVAAAARRREVQDLRICFRQRDQLADGSRRYGRMQDQHVRRDSSETDRSEILFGIVGQLAIHVWIDCVPRAAHENGVAVGQRLGGEIGCNDAVCTAAVVNDDLLMNIFCQPHRDHARDEVISAARRIRQDEPDRFGRISLRGRRCRVKTKHDEQRDQQDLCSSIMPNR